MVLVALTGAALSLVASWGEDSEALERRHGLDPSASMDTAELETDRLRAP
jgi:hypothetical protein